MVFEACQRAVVVLAAFWCAFLVFAIALAVLPLESLQADPALRSLITASMMGVRAHMLSAGRLAGQEYFQQACQIVVESANLSFCTYLREMGICVALLHFTGANVKHSLEEAEWKLEMERLLEKAEENERKQANVKSLADGIPQMEQVISESGAFIPPESQHASCEHEIKKVFMLIEFSKDAKKYQNRVWGDCPATLSNLHYTTEADVVSFVKTFLRDVANAMGIPLELASDFGIKHVAPDICVLSLGSRLVGVVEIKKPQKNVLEMPTVLGELFDQMILVEGFYMSGPVIGILTTLEDWMFCWFPADTAHFSTEFEPYTATSAFRTPQKASAPAGDSTSPPRDTPSRKNRWSHGVELPEDDCEDPDEFVWTGEVVERALHTSPVINAYTDYDLLLQYLCSAFTRMTQVKLNQRRGVPRSLFKLHKGEDASPKISFHPIDGIPFSVEKITSNKFPRANTKMLLALEDLGRGSTGKAWLCCTLSTSPALCVLKFANKSNNVSARLKQEKEWWDAVYPQFMGMTKVEVWGGSDALVMPHICAIPEVERDEFRERICAMMRTSFHKRGYKHQDVAWRNIGYYVDMEDNIKSPVLFDLERVSAGVESDEWVTEAMSRLFA